MIVLFGGFELSGDGVLRRHGLDLHIAAKPLSLLRVLILHRDRFVSRTELVSAVWPGEYVGEAAFASVMRDLRRILGDNAREARFIETRRGVGFRFVHPVLDAPQSEIAPSRWGELVRHFENALSGLDRIGASRGGSGRSQEPPRERGPLLIALARARWGAGATDEARAEFQGAIRLARSLGDAEMFAQAALGFAGRSDASLDVNETAVELLQEALELLGDENLALSSEVAARLGTELYHRDDGAAARNLTADALNLAERSRIPSALAYALTARHFTLNRADVAPAERRPLAERAIALVESDPASDVLALGLQERLADLLEEGDGREFDATFLRYGRIVERLEQPFFLWMRSVLAASRLIRIGELEQALSLANQVLQRGVEIGSPNAHVAYFAMLFAARHAEGRLAELFALVQTFEGAEADLPIMRAAGVAIAESTESADAFGNRVDTLMGDLPSFPRDANWIGLLGILAQTIARIGQESSCRVVYECLEPYAGRMVVAGHGALFFGAVDHHLGLLAARLGEQEASRVHFDVAERLHERGRAPLWLDRTRAARE